GSRLPPESRSGTGQCAGGRTCRSGWAGKVEPVGDTDDEFSRSVSATRFTARPAPDSRPRLRTTTPEWPSGRASFQRQDCQDAPSADQATIRHRTGKAQAGAHGTKPSRLELFPPGKHVEHNGPRVRNPRKPQVIGALLLAPGSPRTPRGASSERCRSAAAERKTRSERVSRLALHRMGAVSVKRASRSTDHPRGTRSYGRCPDSGGIGGPLPPQTAASP